MRTFDHYCEYRRTPNGVVLSPVQLSRWLVIFCDEINLPAPDKYGTQRVISFLRQLVEMVCITLAVLLLWKYDDLLRNKLPVHILQTASIFHLVFMNKL